MARQLRSRDIAAPGFMTFALSVGIGSIIFPSMVGLQADEHIWTTAFGFLIIAVGLPVLMVVALTKAGDGIDSLSTPINKVTGVLLTAVCYLAVEPLFAMPCITTVSFRVGIALLTGDSVLPLFIYNLVYSAAVILVSLCPDRLLDIIGNFLAPLKIVALVILSVTIVVRSAGSTNTTTEAYQNTTFSNDFVNDYLTIGTLGVMMFGIVIVNTTHSRGVTEVRLPTCYTVWTDLMAGAGSALLYLALFRPGSDSASLVDQFINGTAILHAYAQHTSGGGGSFLLTTLVFIAYLAMVVDLTCARAEFFTQYIPLPYRTLVFTFGGFSMMMSSLGLSQLVQISVPVLTTIYPSCITLAALGFTCPRWHNSPHAIAPSASIDLLFGILGGIKTSTSSDILLSQTQRLPLAGQGLAWLMPTMVVVVPAIIRSCAVDCQVTSSAHQITEHLS